MSENADADVADAIRDLTKQIDYLGNAVNSAAETVAKALAQQDANASRRSQGISQGGTFT